MTDVPPPPEEASPDRPQEKKPYVIPFHADIHVASPMWVVDSGVELLIQGQRVVVAVTEEQRLKLQGHPPEPDRLYRVLLWFRTVQGCVQDLECFGFFPLRGERAKSVGPGQPQCSVGAVLREVNRDEGFVIVEVSSNPTGAVLEPFNVQFWADPNFLNRHFKMDQTYLIHGQYDFTSGHLIATNFRSVNIGKPILPRVVKQITPFNELMKIRSQKNRRQKKEQAKALAAAAKATGDSEDQSTVTSPES